MASIYRFSRKSKKEDPKKDPAKKAGKGDDFFPLLFSEEAEGIKATAPIEEKKTETAPVDSAALEETREISFEKQEKERKSVSNEETIDLNAASQDASEEDKALPEELLKALQETQVDAKKLDEVFHLTKGSLTGETTKAEYDETTHLLKEIFGSDDGIKAKGKKADEATAPEEAPKEARASEEYVAVHDAEEEKTREYHATFSIEEALENIQPEMIDQTVPEMAEEVKVPDPDNPYCDTYDEIEEKQRQISFLPEEYTQEEEYDEFAEHLRNRHFKTLWSCIWSFLIFLGILYLESATFSGIYHPAFLKPGGIYNMIYLLIDIQMVLVAFLLALPTVSCGAKSLFKGHPSRNTIPFLALCLGLIHPIVMLFSGQAEYPLFGAVAAFFAVMSALANHMEARRIYRTFRICGKRGEKLVASPLPSDSAEAEAFREQLEGEPCFFTVHKTGFIENFFQRVNEPSRGEKSFGITLILALVLSLGFAILSYVKEGNTPLAITRLMTMAMMTLPLSGIFTVCLPFSHLSKKAEKRDSAIVSAKAADEHAACDVVSFTDKEIFPPKSVKVTTIRTYGQNRIDNAILYAAMIFQKLGGPLSLVFKKTISGVYSEIPEDFDFLEITADGMCAKIDGKDIFVGNKNYLLSYDFGYTKDEMDEGFEAKFGKIMYMVIGSELAAKFYVRYSISKRFKKTIFSLFKSGICPAVKTCDPNIDSDLFRTLLQNDKIPAGIIKTCDAMKDAPVQERSESGVVCTSTIANLLHTFTLCDALCHLTKANIIVKIISMLIGAGVVLFLFWIENLTKITGLFALIYQILWMIPVIIPSLSE